MNCRRCVLFVLVLALGACRAALERPWPNGSLLLVGGGLDDDARAVYERFVELAGRPGSPRLVVLTAATGPQDQEATDKVEALRTWAPDVPVDVVLREASTADTVAAIDRATGLFFTGGDQKRITARYRPDDQPTPEWLAMVRLLSRGGVIAGASAGCAMMGQQMLLGGRNAPALGIAPATPPAGGEEPVALGPRLGPGMRFLREALTDSHFFERDRIGRVVASLLVGPERLAIGVGEDAAVEVDLSRGELAGVTGSESLLVDATAARRDGTRISGLRARLLAQGERLPLRAFADGPAVARPADGWRDVPVVEPGQNRQLASWRLFRQAAQGAAPVRLGFDGWRVCAWRAGDDVVFDVEIVD